MSRPSGVFARIDFDCGTLSFPPASPPPVFPPKFSPPKPAGRWCSTWSIRRRKCKRVGEVIVAADDPRIVDALRPFGTRCVLTSAEHPERHRPRRRSGPIACRQDRSSSTCRATSRKSSRETIDALVRSVEEWRTRRCRHRRHAFPAGRRSKRSEPGEGRALVNGRAMYFSRSAIPFHATGHQRTHRRIICIWAFTPIAATFCCSSRRGSRRRWSRPKSSSSFGRWSTIVSVRSCW